MLRSIFLLILLSILAPLAFAATPWQILDGFSRPIDLRVEADLKSLGDEIDSMLKVLKNDTRPDVQDDSKIRPDYFLNNADVSNKKLKKALKAMRERVAILLTAYDEAKAREVAELHRSLELNLVAPVQDHYSVGEYAKIILRDFLFNPNVKGHDPASNLARVTGDLSTADPLPNSLWTRPQIGALDLKYGFNRTAQVIENGEHCTYKEPKTGWGTRPGFTIDCSGKVVKIKFKEVHSEPFASRVFWALGYNVDPVDYVKTVTIDYDRRMFTEFNSRKKINIRVTFLGMKVSDKSFAGYFDPFDYIEKAVLKDGSELDSPALRAFLKKGDEFIPEHEEQIATLITKQIQAQEEDKTNTRVGPWSWSEFDHADRREMRGAVLLAGWLNWYDVRYDNNRTLLTEQPDGSQAVRHMISDVGGVLGRATNFFALGRNTIEDIEHFGDRFTSGSPALRTFRILKLRTYDKNKAFHRATLDDVKWMAKLINELKPSQIEDALRAAGFDETETKEFLAKLLSRRDYMNKDLFSE